MRSLLLISVALAASAAFAVRADPGVACSAHGDFPSILRVKRVLPEGRIHFQSEPKPCPPGASCGWRTKAYLVAGDVVLAGGEANGFRCVLFVTAKGNRLANFLPSAALEPATEGRLDPAFLVGTWRLRNPAAKIVLAHGVDDAITAEGFAYWEGDRPGALHDGAFSGEATPAGGTLTYEGKEGDPCKVTIRRRGPYLVVSDNLGCGGLNVTFSGVYVKVARAAPDRE